MKTYRLDIDRLPARRRQILGRYGVILLVVVACVVALSQLLSHVISPVTVAIPVVLMSGVMAFTVRSLLEKVAENYENARVELRPGQLTIRPNGGAAMTLHEEDVQSIQETTDGSLVVRGRTSAETICLSPDLVDFDDLRSELANWRDIEPFRHNWSPKTLGRPLLLVALALPMVAPFVMPESAMTWGGPLIMVLYLSAMGAVGFMTIKRAEKKWVRVLFSIALGVVAIGMFGMLVRLVSAM